MSVAAYIVERTTRDGFPLLTFEERLRLRHLRDELTRSRIRKVEPRLGRDSRGSSLPEHVLLAAHRSFKDGATMIEIAESLWRTHGFKSVHSCAQSLANGFRKLS